MEYAGYIPTPNLDIAGLTSKLAKSIYGIETSKQEKRAEMEKLKSDTDEALNSVEMSDSQDFSDLTLKMIDNGRTKTNDAYKKLKSGEITPAEYRMTINKLNKNLGTFANTAKAFDEQFKEYAKRQEPGANGFPTASHFEYKLAEMFGKVAELDKKEARFNDKGDLFVIDKVTGEAQSIDVLNRPENIIQDRFDLVGSTANIVKGFEASTTWKDLGKGGEKAIEGFLQNGASEEAIATGINSMVASPRSAVSIFTDWGNVDADYYMNEQEYGQMYNDKVQKKVQAKQDAGLSIELSADEKKEIEMSLIKIEKQGSIINPVLSPDQMKKTKEIADNFIRSNIYEKVTGSPKQDWSKPASFYGDGGGATGDATPMYEKLHNAWFAGTPGLGTLAALSGGRYKFEWNKAGGMDVYEEKSFTNKITGNQETMKVKASTQPITELEDLAGFFYGQTEGKGTKEALVQFRKERDIYTSKNPPKKKATISQADFNAKWSKLKKGEKLTGPDGKVYTKG
jgi:hypothetical protein